MNQITPFLVGTMLLSGSHVLAQNEQERAEDTLSLLGSITDLLTQDYMEEIVTPFVTDTPSESELTPEQFEDAQYDIRTGNGSDSRAYSSTVDSALNRPDVEIGSNSLDLADSAIEQSDAVLGSLFTADGGTCDAIFEGGDYSGIRMCRAILSRRYETCTEQRNIAVDREDTWSCEVRDTNYRKQCNRNITWSCSGSQGGVCRKQAVSFSPAPVWNDPGRVAQISFGATDNGLCSINTRTIYVTVADYMNLSRLNLNGLSFDGVAQVRLNGANTWTYGTTATGNLNVQDRDCGKNCLIPAVYAGSTWIEDCGTTHRNSSPTADVLPYINQPLLGPSSDLNSSPVTVATGQVSNRATIQIITGNLHETGMSATFRINGDCCSAFTANLGSAC